MPWHRHHRLGKRSLWRLFACTEGAKEYSDDENFAATSTELSDSDAGHRQRQLRANKSSRLRHGKPGSKRSNSLHFKRRSLKTNEDESFDNDDANCSEEDATGDKPRRQNTRLRLQHRHHHHPRSHRTCRCPSGDAASQAGCGAGNCRGRISKRLMVAMLEDGCTGKLNSCDGCHRGKMRVRTTHDEISIKQIFKQLSATMDANYPSDSPLEIPRSSALRTVHRGQMGNLASPRTSRTMTLPASPMPQQPPTRTRLPPPSPTSPPPPPPPPPRPSQEPRTSSPPVPPRRTSALAPAEQGPQAPQTSGWVRVSLHSSSVQLQQDSEQKQQLQQQNAKCLASKPQIQDDKKTAIRGSGRRGYRLFRRVFSASDNYYAAPFPPMETIKLTSDEDQWEDLEILVTGHNGVKAIMPKIAETRPDSRNPAETAKARPGAPQIAATETKPDNRNPSETARARPAASQIPRPFQTAQPEGHPSAAGDVDLLPLTKQKQQSSKPTQRQQQQQQQQSQQLNQCNQLQSPSNVNHARMGAQIGVGRSQNNSQEPNALHFGFSRQHQHPQHAQQQRRANPLMSPNRLLHRLGPPCTEAGCGRQRAILLPPTPPPPPLSPNGASPKPQRERPGYEFGIGRSSRYGKL